MDRKLRRKNELVWRRSKLEVHKQIYVGHRNMVSDRMEQAKRDYCQSLLSHADMKTAFRTVNTLLCAQSPALPEHTDGQVMCEQFADFFGSKID